jgi:acetyltransferase-like isoleucine patch superfamily enzyme
VSLGLINDPGVVHKAYYSAQLNYLIRKLQSCGERFTVFFPIIIEHPEFVIIGDDVSLAAYVHIWGGGSVKIGDRVMIGTHTSISSLTHDYRQEIMYNTLLRKEVLIQNVPAKVIVAGVPAKIIKNRFQ